MNFWGCLPALNVSLIILHARTHRFTPLSSLGMVLLHLAAGSTSPGSPPQTGAVTLLTHVSEWFCFWYTRIVIGSPGSPPQTGAVTPLAAPSRIPFFWHTRHVCFLTGCHPRNLFLWTHTHNDTHTHAHTHTLSLSLSLTLTHTDTHTHPHPHTNTARWYCEKEQKRPRNS